MNRRMLVVGPVIMALFGGGSGCEQRPAGWSPVLEETSTAFLETEVDRLAERVRIAQENLEADLPAARTALSEASSSLEHLRQYYLPLFQARERAYNAYRSLYLADRDRVTGELGRIEEILGEMAETAQGARLQEVESLAEVLADARVAVESGGEGAAQALETLARALNQAALKGDLVLTR